VAARQAEDERMAAEAARRVEEERQAAEAALEAERQAVTARLAEEERKAAEAACGAEDERRAAEAAAETAYRAEGECQAAEAARRAEEERKERKDKQERKEKVGDNEEDTGAESEESDAGEVKRKTPGETEFDDGGMRDAARAMQTMVTGKKAGAPDNFFEVARAPARPVLLHRTRLYAALEVLCGSEADSRAANDKAEDNHARQECSQGSMRRVVDVLCRPRDEHVATRRTPRAGGAGYGFDVGGWRLGMPPP